MRIFASVKSRIYLAFGSLTLLVMIIGGSAIILMSNAEDLFDEYRKTARESLTIDEKLRDVSVMRIDFLNYLLNPTAEWAEKTREIARSIEAPDPAHDETFAHDPDAIAAIAEVQGLATQYLAWFDTVAADADTGTEPRSHALTASLTSVGPQMYDILYALSNKAHARQNELGPRIAAQEQMQLVVIMVIAALAILTGIALAIITGRWLTGTFTNLTRTMGQLTDGHYDIAIAGTQARNELGEMARALETFRVNGISVQLAEEEKQRRNGEMAARAQVMASFQAAFDTVIERANNGDFTGRIAAHFGDPEIDRISGNLDGMMTTIEGALDEADRVLGAMARADLRDRMMGEYQGAFARLKLSTNSVADKIETITLQLRDTSRALKTATAEILAGANDLSERTTRQAATIEETSAAMDQLASTVALNAERARDASTSTDKVTHVVEASSTVMDQATSAMSAIETSSGKISNIIGLIDDIAFQTNLLALNASVEAARAGEAGKGFAVVAVEVRRLAQSAAQASSEVKLLIEQSASEVRNGTKLVADVAGRLNEIIAGVRQTATVMETIASDSQTQAAGIAEVNVAVRQMDEMTQHNAALVEEMNASIEQTEGQAGKLDGIVETFTLDDGGAMRIDRSAPPAAPAPVPMEEPGARALLGKVRKAAKTYFGGATAEDWNEF